MRHIESASICGHRTCTSILDSRVSKFSAGEKPLALCWALVKYHDRIISTAADRVAGFATVINQTREVSLAFKCVSVLHDSGTNSFLSLNPLLSVDTGPEHINPAHSSAGEKPLALCWALMKNMIILLNHLRAWMRKWVLISNAPFRTTRRLYIAQPGHQPNEGRALAAVAKIPDALLRKIEAIFWAIFNMLPCRLRTTELDEQLALQTPRRKVVDLLYGAVSIEFVASTTFSAASNRFLAWTRHRVGAVSKLTRLVTLTSVDLCLNYVTCVAVARHLQLPSLIPHLLASEFVSNVLLRAGSSPGLATDDNKVNNQNTQPEDRRIRMVVSMANFYGLGFRSYWASPDPDAMSDISDSGQETPRDSHSPLPPELVNGMSSLNLEEESHMPGTFSASSPLASDLHNGLAALSLDGTKSPNTSSLPPPAFDVVSRMNALSLDTPNNDHAEDMIANLITAATMTATSTDGSSHSKLFSSSDDAYPPTSAPSHTYRPLPLSDALQSVQATVNAPRAALSPSCTPGRQFGSASSSSPSPRRQSGSNQSPGSLQSTKPVCSPPQLNSVFTRHDKNELDDLEGINKNLQEQEELIFGDGFSSLDDEQQALRLDLVHTFTQKNLQRVTQYFEKATDRQKKARQRSSTSSPLKVEEELAEQRKELHERLRSLLVKTDTIKLLRIPKAPVKINTDYVHQSDFFYMDQINQVLVLLAVICNMVIGLSIVQCNFLVGVSVMLDEVIAGMPNSLTGALKRFGAEGRFDSYATCPTCNFTNKGVLIDNGQYHYPETCTNRVVGESVNSFHDYLACCLGDPTYLECSKKAADDAYNAISSGQQHDDIQDVFDAEFTMDFKGPDGSLFVNRGAKIRLAFSIHTDFLNPNGITHRGPTQSIGVISCTNLALDPSICYLPKYLYHASIIPGPKEPDVDEMDHFVRPVIEKFATAWRPGLKVSQTADSKLESVVEAGIFLSVNDLPAARKVAGFQGVNSEFICTVCPLRGRNQIFSTNHSHWNTRDVNELRHLAEQYRDTETVAQRKSLFKQRRVRWSSLWLLKYWDPTKMLVIDTMHCLLEGIVHYHCCHVLRLDASAMKTKTDLEDHRFAYDWPWVDYSDEVAPPGCMLKEKDVSRVAKLQTALCIALKGDKALTLDELWTQLFNSGNLDALHFVVHSLQLSLTLKDIQDNVANLYLKRVSEKSKAKQVETHFPFDKEACTKSHFVAILINWL
ncbi:hypothetical protein D9758_009812 [Tetrapyrgos nigripes]|uniref:Uncharacterized protein n=1 Tax=Tetrapyrgos nigripes TaxID=182062 RepID=A0A8H5LR25_9AGAR|nr:hypothetical protein D9758_009812 [Tetrapyrgos nigripes]